MTSDKLAYPSPLRPEPNLRDCGVVANGPDQAKMATSQSENTKRTDAPAVTDEVEETVVLPSEAAPAAATGGEASTSSEPAAPASQEQTSAEAASEPTAAAGPSSAVEQDPAPIQPPIQPVSVSDIAIEAFIIHKAVLCIGFHINTTPNFPPLLKLPAGNRLQ